MWLLFAVGCFSCPEARLSRVQPCVGRTSGGTLVSVYPDDDTAAFDWFFETADTHIRLYNDSLELVRPGLFAVLVTSPLTVPVVRPRCPPPWACTFLCFYSSLLLFVGSPCCLAVLAGVVCSECRAPLSRTPRASSSNCPPWFPRRWMERTRLPLCLQHPCQVHGMSPCACAWRARITWTRPGPWCSRTMVRLVVTIMERTPSRQMLPAHRKRCFSVWWCTPVPHTAHLRR